MLYLSKELYDKETVLKAAYAFTDEAYFHLDADNDYYLVSISPRGKSTVNNIENQFENELIAQQTRRMISQNTKSIREMIITRALASTVVDVSDTKMPDFDDDEEFSASEILQDWFEKE